MNAYEFVIVIVLVVTVGRIIERRHAARKRDRREYGNEGGTRALSEDEVRLDALEERVQVLERIVTDQGYELRQKFRDLEG